MMHFWSHALRLQANSPEAVTHDNVSSHGTVKQPGETNAERLNISGHVCGVFTHNDLKTLQRSGHDNSDIDSKALGVLSMTDNKISLIDPEVSPRSKDAFP